MDIPKSSLSEWYHAVLDEAEIVDNRYPLKGCLVWRPFGWALRNSVMARLQTLLESTGHRATYFPLLIPEPQLTREESHIKGFKAEVYWVTRGGETPLDVNLALRPTSETVIYPMFALWVRSYADLPLKIFQTVNTFRYETKHTRPLLRVRELSTFNESHCCHADQKDAEHEMALIKKDVYNPFFESLGVPTMIVQRPDWDKFPGADYTHSWEYVMPDGKTLQVATSHNLGTNFSRIFDIKYETAKGRKEHVVITCHGISERSIGALIAAHGDDKGLALPSALAPTQVVIVPILFKGKEKPVLAAAKKLFDSLRGEFRVQLDDSEKTPGDKYYYWELRGVPLRVELGPRDLEKDSAMLVRRDGEKKSVKLSALAKEIPKELAALDDSIAKKARKQFESFIERADSLDAAKGAEKRGKVVLVPVCDDVNKCGKKIEDSMETYEFRGTVVGRAAKGKCASCGRAAAHEALLSQAY
jgi:prolyl-tRNA synthetase